MKKARLRRLYDLAQYPPDTIEKHDENYKPPNARIR